LFDFLRYAIGGAIWFFVIGVALWRGERPERIVAVTSLIAMFATPLVQMRPLTNNSDLAILLVDATVMVVITGVALRWDRWWPLFNAGFHLVMVGVHVVKVSRPDTSQFVYATVVVLFSYLGILSLGAGVAAVEWRRFQAQRRTEKGRSLSAPP
jgi:hypothetical protein